MSRTTGQIRKILTSLNYHRRGEKRDICIFSSPRSGSTWLMEIIYTQPGIVFINEPLGKAKLDYYKLLEIKTRWRYNSLTSTEEQALRLFLQDNRKLGVFRPVNIFDRNYKFVSNRRVFKIIRANALIEWFAKALNAEIVYLIRHPISQSLSCIRRGHHPRLYEFVQDEHFCEAYLSQELVDFVRTVEESGSTLHKFITQWCLSNLVPLNRLAENNDWLVITYEELVMRPEKILDLLFERLGLEEKEKLLSRVSTPSKVTDSSSNQTRLGIKGGDSSYLIKKWTANVSDEEAKELFDIVARFDIDAYRAGDFFACSQLLHFGPFQL